MGVRTPQRPLCDSICADVRNLMDPEKNMTIYSGYPSIYEYTSTQAHYKVPSLFCLSVCPRRPTVKLEVTSVTRSRNIE